MNIFEKFAIMRGMLEMKNAKKLSQFITVQKMREMQKKWEKRKKICISRTINVRNFSHFSHFLRKKCSKFLAFIAFFAFIVISHIYWIFQEIFLKCEKFDNREMKNEKNSIIFAISRNARKARNLRNAIIIAHA